MSIRKYLTRAAAMRKLKKSEAWKELEKTKKELQKMGKEIAKLQKEVKK